MFRLLLIFLLIATVSNAKNAGKMTWKKFSDAAYSFQYPSHWELDTSHQMGTRFIINASVDNEQDKFRENVNLTIQDLSGKGIDLDKFIDSTKAQIEKYLKEPVLITDERKSDKGSYHHLIYSARLNIFDLTFEQYIWIVADKAYILTLSVETKSLEAYSETGSRILNSFKLK